MRKILFISNDAFYAGAQLLMLKIIDHLYYNQEISFDIVFLKEGKLEKEILKYKTARSFIWNKDFYSKRSNKIFDFKSKFKNHTVWKYFSKQDYILIYCNTILVGEILEEFLFLKKPILSHIHELDSWISAVRNENRNIIWNNTQRFIAVSDAVKQNLVKRYNVESDKIDVIHGFVDSDIPENTHYQDLRSVLKLKKESVIIGSVGVEDWRKGKDLFVQIANHLLCKNLNLDIHFVWIGGQFDQHIQYDLNKFGISANVHILEHTKNVRKYFSEFKIFAMTSREDPFPLVNLEALSVGVPIVCFENAGGSIELVNENCGFSSSYCNTLEFANMLEKLLIDSECYEQKSVTAKKIIVEKYSKDIQLPKIVNLIKEMVGDVKS